MAPVRIRLFQETDVPALHGVFYSAIHQLAAGYYAPAQLDAWAPADRDMAQWRERMLGIKPYVAEIDGRIAGYADLQADGYIDHFFVSGDFGRRGVGTALMSHILAQAEARQLTALTSDVSLAAEVFFTSFGFEVETRQAVPVRGQVLHNAKMRKRLVIGV
ncbi:MAG: GNAT family N-acetyltransferase [Burkholderiales bacterium]|nr:GNAT family N-acetyltransferase [Burkholderiales bacterium]